MIRGRTIRQMLLTVLGAGIVTYSVLNLPVESYWQNAKTLKSDLISSESSASRQWTGSVKQASEINFLLESPFEEEDEVEEEEEENDIAESTGLDVTVNLTDAFLNAPPAPPLEWNKRLPLANFPQMEKCAAGYFAQGNTSALYPCRPQQHGKFRSSLWPLLLQPSNGKLLRRIANRRYDDPKVEKLVEEQLAVQMERLSRVSEACKEYPEQQERDHLHLIWAAERRPPLVYCPIYKSASTTWMTNFLRLEHLNEENPAFDKYLPHRKEWAKYMPRFGGGQQRVHKDYPKPKTLKSKREIFQNAIRFIVVRHPFERLVSVYRDKIARPNPLPFRPYFQELQRAMIARYRSPDSGGGGGDGGSLPLHPTFAEFVDYLIESTANLTTRKDWIENVVCWIPYWVQCGVCASDYQAVIKVETMASDEQFLAHVANLTEIQDSSNWRNRRRGPPPAYFKTLTRRQVEDLYRRYQADFDLFGYTIDDYVKAARQV